MKHELSFTLIEGETPEELVKKFQEVTAGKITGLKVTDGIWVTLFIDEDDIEVSITGEDEKIDGYYDIDGAWIDFAPDNEDSAGVDEYEW